MLLIVNFMSLLMVNLLKDKTLPGGTATRGPVRQHVAVRPAGMGLIKRRFLTRDGGSNRLFLAG
jgi:hypothetical protein